MMNATINVAQKTLVEDFKDQFFALMEKYWNPIACDEYWDSVTDEAMSLIDRFRTKDAVINSFFTNLVVAFLNSREEMV